jgi:hypothetical protein
VLSVAITSIAGEASAQSSGGPGSSNACSFLCQAIDAAGNYLTRNYNGPPLSWPAVAAKDPITNQCPDPRILLSQPDVGYLPGIDYSGYRFAALYPIYSQVAQLVYCIGTYPPPSP